MNVKREENENGVKYRDKFGNIYVIPRRGPKDALREKAGALFKSKGTGAIYEVQADGSWRRRRDLEKMEIPVAG